MIRLVRLARGLALAASAVLPACSSGSGSGNPGDGNVSAFSSGLPRDRSFGSVTDADVGTLCEAWANHLIGPGRDAFCKTRVWSAASAALTSWDAAGCGGLCTGAFDGAEGMHCTEECADATGSVCTYECSGASQVEFDANCAAAYEAACGQTDADLQQACTEAQVKCEEQPAAVADVVGFCDFQKPDDGCTATVAEFEACVAEYFLITDQTYSGFSCSTLTVAEVEASLGRPPAAPTGDFTACKTFNDKCPGAFDDGISEECGNGVLDPGEQCDGTNLDGETCASLLGDSLPNGELTCNRACVFDGSACTAP